MTVVSTTSRWSYNGDASTTVFPYDNLIFAASDLQVFVDGTLQTLNTDYTVSGVGDNGGGAVTFISGAPASGTNNVLIVRDVPFTQETDLPEGGPFPSAAVEEVADKNTVLSQQLNDLLSNKSLALDSLDPATSIGRLPLKTALAGTFLAFDGSGDPIAAAGTSADLGPVSSFINTLLDDADATTARTTLGLGALAVLSALTEISQNIALTGIISPTQLTASQNNYNPTGLATASTLRLSSDASRTITGLQGGASGRVLILENVGSNAIVLSNESASSTAANRFALTADVTLDANDLVALKYDATTSRWRALTKPAGLSSTTAAGLVEKATQAEIEAGTADKFVEAANLKAAFGFSEFFESSEQTVSNDTRLDVAHGLSSTPKFVQLILRCNTADAGYSVGNEINYTGHYASAADRGAIALVDSTNVSIIQGFDIPLLNPTTFNTSVMTEANWRWIVRAWA